MKDQNYTVRNMRVNEVLLYKKLHITTKSSKEWFSNHIIPNVTKMIFLFQKELLKWHCCTTSNLTKIQGKKP